MQEGLHTDLGGGKYGGFGLAHIRGRRFNKDGRPVLTHSQEILRNHDYESDLDAISNVICIKTQEIILPNRFMMKLVIIWVSE